MDSPATPPSSQPSISSWLRLSPLGSGSFGHVFLALNLDDSSLFAVKSAPAPASSPELLALQNELQILQSLHSPFIIQCLGAELSPEGTPRNLFLEYMDGGSLADAAKRSGGKLHDELLVRYYTRSILQGLAYLHENGVVHCDIKSQNILIGSSGVKIADFGAARRVGDALPSSRNLRGTPLWMAPEVAQGTEPKTSSDIWSLGCTVVELLQGRPPWGHVDSVAAALFKVGCSKENPPLPESISAEAKEFLSNCLQRDPEARWTAAELLKHPFVCKLDAANDDRNWKQASPRSTLDFLYSDSESDWEEEYSVPTLCFSPLRPSTRPTKVLAPAASTRILQAPVSVSPEANWITVKWIRGWSEERQMPFMQGGAGEAQEVRRGCEVSFASAQFLRNRGANSFKKFCAISHV